MQSLQTHVQIHPSPEEKEEEEEEEEEEEQQQQQEKTKNKKFSCIFNFILTTTEWIVWTDDNKLLQESNLTARQRRRALHHVVHLI